MSTTTDQLHHVTVKHTRDEHGDITATDLTFECRGDRTSECHIYPGCECENWSLEHDKEHPRVAHDDCWLEQWFGIGHDVCPYAPPSDDLNYLESDLPERSGPITFEYDECILWRWADEVSA